MSFSLPFANSLIVFGTLSLLAVFTLAAFAKLRHIDRTREGLISFGVPAAWARPAHGVLVLVEVLIAVSLAYPPTRLIGTWAALGALMVFTVAITWQLLHGRRPGCACFGALSSGAIRWKSVGRNLVLIVLAGGLIALPAVGSMPIPPVAIPWSALGALVWIGISVAWLLLLTRQNGRLLGRIQQLEHLGHHATGGVSLPIAPAGPVAVGALVPPLGLSDARDRPFNLHSLRGTPVLLLFLDASCSHCRPLLAHLSTHHSHNVALVVISADAALQQDLPSRITLLVDPSLATVGLFGLRGTPAGVFVDANGALAQPVVHGTGSIRALLDQFTQQEVTHEWASV